MPGYVSNVSFVCWQHTDLAIAVHGSHTDGRKFGPKRIQELLLYLTCRADDAGPQGQRIGTANLLKESRKDDPVVSPPLPH
jgi:hypothetical protein